MPSKEVEDALNNYNIPDNGFTARHNAAKEKYQELLAKFTSGDNRPVMDAMQLIISKATFFDWLTLRLDRMLNERGLTVALVNNGQYLVSNENEALRWFDDPASAYMFALERMANEASK